MVADPPACSTRRRRHERSDDCSSRTTTTAGPARSASACTPRTPARVHAGFSCAALNRGAELRQPLRAAAILGFTHTGSADEAGANQRVTRRLYAQRVAQAHEIEFVFEPQEEGGYHVYAPDLPGLHTQGETLDEATNNARQALSLYVEGLREDGRTLDTGIIRRKLPLPA
jgi:predicted RNase H-like HicB family nuclease